jgi:transglutaminase-like putative cysteine protease
LRESLRTAAVSMPPALVVAWTWLRLEQPREALGRAVALAALGVAVALVRLLLARVVALVVAIALGARLAFGVSLLHPHRFFEPLGSRASNGLTDFYDVHLPFDPRLHPDMRSLVLTAVLGFALLVALLVDARRPLPALLALLLGAGWPATLLGSSGALASGTLLLLGGLAILAGLGSRRPPRVTVPAVAVLAAIAFGVASSTAGAQHAVVPWQTWRPIAHATKTLSVSFVWDSSYKPIRFPHKRTRVLEVAAPEHTSLYWRAAVLDDFLANRWDVGAPRPADELEPPDSTRPDQQIEQTVTVDALGGTRLVGGGQPIRFQSSVRLDQPVTGIALLGSGLSHGFRYSVFSYAPQPTAAALARSQPEYPSELIQEGLLDVYPGVTMPAFGSARRPSSARAVRRSHPELKPYAPLATLAEQVAGSAQSPYAAAFALQRWFRSTGGFTYTDHPAQSPFPLVDFVAHTRAGYCQHFAGAMALMLRYLGVPARVAVGFSSGTYSSSKQAWLVTDHDAHAWVEVWFSDYGWLPFDPTPASARPEQGELSAAYASPAIRAAKGSGKLGGKQDSPQASHRHGDEFGAGHGTIAQAQSHHSRSLLETLVLILLLLLAAASGAIVVVKLARLAVGRLARDPRRVASACREELAAFLVDQRIVAARSATLHELGALLRRELAVDPERFVAAASAARFGRPETAAATARDARRELRSLLHEVRHRLTGRERLRGLLSLRSLGVDAAG